MRYCLNYTPENAICDVENGVCYNTFPNIDTAQSYLAENGLEDCTIVPLPDHLTAHIPEYEYTQIGRFEMGCDGADQYFLVRGIDGAIIADDLLEDVAHRFYAETYQEAGGYFCKQFDLMAQTNGNYVVRICHRYDV